MENETDNADVLGSLKCEDSLYDDEDSLFDFPSLFESRTNTRSTNYNRKTTSELLAENLSLREHIRKDNAIQIATDEKINDLHAQQLLLLPDVSSEPTTCSVTEDFQLFCVIDDLQFFGLCDISLAKCGYDTDLKKLTHFEEQLMHFSPVELENVLSSVTVSKHSSCISDCKSFITFLFRSISITTDFACVNSCYDLLILTLNEHPDVRTMEFSSAEVFMLLFNYGIDVDNCHILQLKPEIKNHLLSTRSEPKRSLKSIPSNWAYNHKVILNALIKTLKVCIFATSDLCDIALFLLWMILDTTIDLSSVHECLLTILELIKEDDWPTAVLDLQKAVICLKFPDECKWGKIIQIVKNIPSTVERGIELRKVISFNALRLILTDVSEEANEFNLIELLKMMSTINSNMQPLEETMKLIDLCLCHLDAPKEVYREICRCLNVFENRLGKEDYAAKLQFSRICARMKLHAGVEDFFQKSVVKEEPDNLKNFPRVENYFPCALNMIKIDPDSIASTTESEFLMQSDSNLIPSDAITATENDFLVHSDVDNLISENKQNNIHIAAVGYVKKEFCVSPILQQDAAGVDKIVLNDQLNFANDKVVEEDLDMNCSPFYETDSSVSAKDFPLRRRRVPLAKVKREKPKSPGVSDVEEFLIRRKKSHSDSSDDTEKSKQKTDILRPHKVKRKKYKRIEKWSGEKSTEESSDFSESKPRKYKRIERWSGGDSSESQSETEGKVGENMAGLDESVSIPDSVTPVESHVPSVDLEKQNDSDDGIEILEIRPVLPALSGKQDNSNLLPSLELSDDNISAYIKEEIIDVEEDFENITSPKKCFLDVQKLLISSNIRQIHCSDLETNEISKVLPDSDTDIASFNPTIHRFHYSQESHQFLGRNENHKELPNADITATSFNPVIHRIHYDDLEGSKNCKVLPNTAATSYNPIIHRIHNNDLNKDKNSKTFPNSKVSTDSFNSLHDMSDDDDIQILSSFPIFCSEDIQILKEKNEIIVLD